MPDRNPFSIALAQYPIGRPQSFEVYAAAIEGWVEEASQNEARLLVFPEYGAMEIASIFGRSVEGDLQQQIGSIDCVVAAIDDLHEALARRFGVYILAASLPVVDGKTPRNRARLFGPEGGRGYQDKVMMTRFEDEEWGIGGGDGLTVFETDLGSMGVTICYDVEFPLIARAMVEAGADLLLVPSCTDTAAGYHRVRVGAMGRALENQCFVAVSHTVGDAAWSPAVDRNTGAAALFGPPERGFVETGVLAEGQRDAAGWIFTEVDLDRVQEARERGQVFNHRDWARQPGLKAGQPVLRRVVVR